MARRERRWIALGLGWAMAAAIAAACSNSTTPHQPAPCPSYSGGQSPGDSLFGVFQLESYCIDTLPAHGPPADTGHVTLKRATPADSITAVFATQGQAPLNVVGTYTLSGADSIHLSGQVATPFGPQPLQLSGRFPLRADTVSVSGRLRGTGAGTRPLRTAIANATPIPERFHFLVPGGADHSERAPREIEAADVVVVLDISDASRLGDLARAITHSHAVACIDHHVSGGSLPGGPRLVAPEAAATAELVFDFASALEWPLPPDAARALYVGILTDTGAFRFANTTPRALRVAGALLERGVDPESIYASVYASAPEGRVRPVTEVLDTLVVEPER